MNKLALLLLGAIIPLLGIQVTRTEQVNTENSEIPPTGLGGLFRSGLHRWLLSLYIHQLPKV